MRSSTDIGAVVLAAGKSSRMGRPKLILPWKNKTVIAHIINTLREAGVIDIAVVTGAVHEVVEEAVRDCIFEDGRIVTVYNPQYEQSEMLVSLQIGVKHLSMIAGCAALLVVLGDQPTIDAEVVRAVIDRFNVEGKQLVVPSYQMRRGHPWLVGRPLWESLIALPPQSTLREFLAMHERAIAYVEVTSPNILKDMDTPEDYRRLTGEDPPDIV